MVSGWNQWNQTSLLRTCSSGGLIWWWSAHRDAFRNRKPSEHLAHACCLIWRGMKAPTRGGCSPVGVPVPPPGRWLIRSVPVWVGGSRPRLVQRLSVWPAVFTADWPAHESLPAEGQPGCQRSPRTGSMAWRREREITFTAVVGKALSCFVAAVVESWWTCNCLTCVLLSSGSSWTYIRLVKAFTLSAALQTHSFSNLELDNIDFLLSPAHYESNQAVVIKETVKSGRCLIYISLCCQRIQASRSIWIIYGHVRAEYIKSEAEINKDW